MNLAHFLIFRFYRFPYPAFTSTISLVGKKIKVWLFAWAFLLGAFNLTGQCVQNRLINGSFNSSEGEMVTAPGWTFFLPVSDELNTPDINDENGKLNTTPNYVWAGTPLASSDGGTWQNLFSQVEFIEQTVTLFKGQSYTLQFEYAAQGIGLWGFNYENPVGIRIYINDILTVITPEDTSQYTWENFTYTFEAPTNTVRLKLSPSGFAYVGIDGACLTATNKPVLKMPNIFTPNNDGINDFFHPQEMAYIGRAHLAILNRWGQLVFETDDLQLGWDGKINGEDCSDGTYFWVVYYKTAYDSKELSMNGIVQKI